MFNPNKILGVSQINIQKWISRQDCIVNMKEIGNVSSFDILIQIDGNILKNKNVNFFQQEFQKFYFVLNKGYRHQKKMTF